MPEEADRPGPPAGVVPVKACAPASGAVAPEDELLDEKRMSLGEHIAELRGRLIVCLCAAAVIFTAGMIGYVWLWDLIRLPLEWVPLIDGKGAMELIRFQWRGPFDAFGIMIMVCLMLTTVLLLPLILYELWEFVSPGLTRRERRAILMIFTMGSGLFVIGVMVAYCLAAPMGMYFLILFNRTLEGSTDLWTGEHYVSFLTMTCLGFGVAFETPLVMAALARVGLVTPADIARHWRSAVLGFAVVGAVLTPPDPFTQVFLAVILSGLYFSGYLLAIWVSRGK